MPLNLRQIEVFRAIMLTSSVSGAAKLLNVSQPAVSRLIAHAEQRLGLSLFDRIKGRLYATPEAKRLFAEVDVVYQGVQRVNEVADDLIENRLGHLRIGCSPSLSQDVMPRAVARFYRDYPDVRIQLQGLTPGLLMQAVLTKQLELGVAFTTETHPGVTAKRLFDNRIVVALPANHPLTARNVLHARDLVGQPLIGYASEIPVGQLIRKHIQEEALDLRFRTEVQQLHVACALVQAGAGIALIDEVTASGPIWTRVMFRPFRPAIAAPVAILHGTYEPLSRLATAFIETLQEQALQTTRPPRR